MASTGKEKKAAKDVVVVALDNFARLEHSDEVIPLYVILAIDRQLEDLLPDHVVSTVDAAEE